MNGSIVYIGIKSVEILVGVKFRKYDNKVTQIFELQCSKSILNLSKDKRFDLYDKLNDKIKEVMISNVYDDFAFISKEEEENRIVFEYSANEGYNKEELKNYFFVIPSFLPPNPGCDFCIHAVKKDPGFFCTLKNKQLVQALKRCVVFKQGKVFKT